MKHLNFFKNRVCNLAALFVMFAFLCSSLHAADITHYITSGSLIIPGSSADNYIITGSTTTNHVVIQSGYKGTVTLKDVTISLASGITSPFLVAGEKNCSNYEPVTNVNIVLDGTNQLLFNGTVAAALQVNQGAQINISAITPTDNTSGSLFARATAATPGNAPIGSGGAAIGAPNSSDAQGWSDLYHANGAPYQRNQATAGGNIIINSGTITAHGAHGAGIGGGYQTWYNGIIIVTGGKVEARAGRHAAGLGSGCPTGMGVMPYNADKSATIALPPCEIEAYGALIGNQDPKLGLAGTKYLTYVNDPAKPIVTIRTEDYEKNANIYLDLTETPGLQDVFDKVHPAFDLTHVWIGKTGASDGLMKVHGLFQNITTFFTDASSSAPATLGRPYMPVSKTTSAAETIILPLFEADISFTDYPSMPLIEGYASVEAEKNAYCLKIEYSDNRAFTGLTYKLQQDVASNFKDLIFLASDSTTKVAAPTTLIPGDVYYIVAPLKDGKTAGAYSDVILIHGTFNSQVMAGYIRRISDQLVVKDDTETNNHIKVTADPPFFTELFQTNKTVKLTLNIDHKTLEPIYNAAKVEAKYIITTEPNYDAAVLDTPVDQWETMNVPSSEGVGKETIVLFKDKPIGTYYIHWYVVSGYLMAHSKDVTDPVRQYGGFGPYNIIAGKTVTYDGNTNTDGAVPVDTTKYPAGDSVAVRGNTGLLTKTDATFIGWSFGASAVVTTPAEVPADLLNANNKFEIVSDATLYAVWATDKNGPDGKNDTIPDYLQFAVIYDGNGHTSGTAPTDNNIYSSTDYIIAKDSNTLARTGGTTLIVFAGWAKTKVNDVLTKATAGSLPADFVRTGNTFTITENTTMYAVWSTDTNGNDIPDIFETGYNVTYDGNGHTSGTAPVDTTTYLSGITITAPAHGDLVRTGGADAIVFAGWTPTKISTVLTVLMAGDTTTAFVRAGNTFKITDNTTMYAVWSTDTNGNEIPDIFETGYKVTYSGNGNSTGTAPIDATTYLTDMSVTVEANSNLAKTSATFIGWSFKTSNLVTAPTEEPADLIQPNATFTIYSDTTLHAVWAIDENGPGGGKDSIPDYLQFAVIYDGNGHTSGTAPVDNNLYSSTDLIIAKDSNTLARTGVTPIVFAGWAKTKVNDVLTKATVGSLPADFVRTGNTFTITENTTMYAVWSTDANGNEIPDIFEDGFSVTYDANGATGTVPVDAATYLTNMSVTAKDKGDLAIDKAIFIGWSFSTSNMVIEPTDVPADLMKPGDNFTITGNTTLYAVWAKDENGPDGEGDEIPDYLQFAVIYDGNSNTGGNAPEDKNLYNDDMNVTLKDKATLARTKCAFVGWSRTVEPIITTLLGEGAIASLQKPGTTFVITEDTKWNAVWGEDNNDNGIPDYKEIKIKYDPGAVDGLAIVDTVELGSTIKFTNMGFKAKNYVLIGWNKMQIPTVVTSLAMETMVTKMGVFYAVGSSHVVTENLDLYAVWAIDKNNDGYPDYGGNIVKPSSGGGTRALKSDDGATGNEAITGTRVWAHGNTLYIESDKAVRAGIYTIGGMLYKQMDIPEGMTSELLKGGIYIVEMEGVRYKVVVK